ncbi:hypothetical protein [Oricola sp.]|uniref:hypothetical protein n=1 Tax=Oricola sp. TaxID=1979950 RepID=UPI0025EB71F4|nr:hypothetical protein [Oricola sp.]MCI5078431.1 hypothetical protein [Oricola sp.]
MYSRSSTAIVLAAALTAPLPPLALAQELHPAPQVEKLCPPKSEERKSKPCPKPASPRFDKEEVKLKPIRLELNA